MSIDKRIGAFSPIESKKVPIHEEFDETNSKHEKKRNLIQVKTAPRWKHIRGLRFSMHPFLDVYKAFGTSTDHQKPIYVSPGGRKKGHQQPLSQARKKCTHISSYFSPNFKFEVFLDKSTNYNDCWNKPFQKTRRKDSLSWIPDHSKVRKKIHF